MDICINDYNWYSKKYCGEWEGATLRKLPLWGRPDDKINFEWPTQQGWAEMIPNAQLLSN